MGPDSVPNNALRWRCDPATLGFASTAELEPVAGVLGQQEAVEALRFGLEIRAPGQNIYVRGLKGTGRLTTVRRMLESIRPEAPPAPDHLYVHDFEHPERPSLITVARGRGELLCEKIGELRRYILKDLATALTSDLIGARRQEVEQAKVLEMRSKIDPLEAELVGLGLALVVREVGGVAQPTILPLHGGKPVSPDRIPELIESGELTREVLELLEHRGEAIKGRVGAVFAEVGALQRQLRQELRVLLQSEAETLLREASRELRELFVEPRVHGWLDALIRDVVHRRLLELEEIEQHAHLYEVNPLACHKRDEPSPVIVEALATTRSLIGAIDVIATPEGLMRADHTCVRAGSLIQADGGVLVLEAVELLTNPGAWSALVRSLRTGKVEFVMPEQPIPMPALKPEPVPISVKVVLLGNADIYYALDQLDHDFPHLFKVLADFDEVLPRDADSITLYAHVLRRIADEELLPAFSAAAVAELVEHGARIASAHNKLTARFGRLSDLAREAAFLARKAEQDQVSGEHVREAIRRTKRRGDLPARRFRELVTDGRIRIVTKDRAVGQINGLAVMSAGPLTYGIPIRITATLGTGTGGTINIERESQLSGAIHTKGFYILGGLLRQLLRSEHPISFEASIAFEQSYGGIDGDSASGAEFVCLLSALTNLPIRQDIAMTGAVDQLGNVLPIGAVNEKIEGFYDTCKAHGLTGTQGVVIPEANVGDLMLRHDLVEACERGEFRVWAVGRIHEAISVFFDHAAGERDNESGMYPEDSVLQVAVMSSFMLWRQAAATPEDFEIVESEPGATNDN
jgi:lon-related putative ATP-dependent protease